MSDRPHFSLVVPGRQALRWASRCLESIAWQIGGFEPQVIYVDDGSHYSPRERDGLAQLVRASGAALLVDRERQWQTGSIARAVEQVTDPYAVLCLLDADDYLLPNALQVVAEAYGDPRVAMTYGNVLVDFRPFQDPQTSYFGLDKSKVNTPYPAEVWETRAFRQDGFRCFHLRTFRRWLWDHINPADLRMPDGTPFRGSGDSAIIYPLLEMLAEPEHVRLIEEPIYVYRLHDQCVHASDKEGQHEGLMTLRFSMPGYAPLDRAYLARRLDEAKRSR